VGNAHFFCFFLFFSLNRFRSDRCS
jgi:hypothetical protein